MFSKIFFCIEQIYITKLLIDLNKSNFFSRVISRVVMLRCQDFIKLMEKYLKDNLNISLEIKRNVQKLKDYYRINCLRQRNKLSGHMQDIEFFERINLWQEIDIDKISHIFESMFNTYKLLESQELVPFKENYYSMLESKVSEIIRYNDQNDIEKTPMMSVDSFAIARYNNSGLLNFHPLHDKCGMIQALNLLLKYEIGFLSILSFQKEFEIWIRSLIIIDVINMLDNLFTRSEIPETSKMYNKGLDLILKESGFSNSLEIMDTFMSNCKLKDKYSDLRRLRNKMCCHLDIDIDLEDYKKEILNYNLTVLLDRYNVLEELFIKVCKSEFILGTYIIPPTPLKDIEIVSNFSENKPFDPNLIPQKNFFVKEGPPKDFSFYLNELSVESEKINNDVSNFFSKAFVGPDIDRKISIEGKVLEYRKAHKFVEDCLLDKNISVKTKLKFLKIINNSKNGYPEQLLYILMTTYNSIRESRILTINYLYQFGEMLAGINNALFQLLKKENIENDKDFVIFYYSILSLLKIHVQNINHKKKIAENEYSLFIKKRIGNTAKRKVITSIFLFSELMFNPELSAYFEKFKEIYISFFQSVIVSNIDGLLKEYSTKMSEKEREFFLKAIDNNNLIFILYNIAKKIEESGSGYYKIFYELAINFFKFNYNDDSHIEYLAYSFYKIEKFDISVQYYDQLIRRNPERYEYFFRSLELFVSIKDPIRFEQYKNKMLDRYNMKNEDIKKLRELEKEMNL